MTNLLGESIASRWGVAKAAAPPETYLSNKQAAQYLWVAEKFLYRMRVTRTGPPYEVRGRKVIYPLSGLERWREKFKRSA